MTRRAMRPLRPASPPVLTVTKTRVPLWRRRGSLAALGLALFGTIISFYYMPRHRQPAPAVAPGQSAVAVAGVSTAVPAPPARRLDRPTGADTTGQRASAPPGATALSAGQPLPGDFPAADEPALLAASSNRLLVFRLAPDPDILVLIFPSLRAQGLALDRIGAFTEKAGVPHDRVLDDRDLAQAIAQAHDTIETYYYGHDYPAAALMRFFATAHRQQIALNPAELAVRGVLESAGLLAPGASGALISLPPAGSGALLDGAARATILRHEISHGVYFTDAGYAAYVQRFWQDVLSPAERAKFRAFLAGQGYDAGNEPLLANEMQAYLVYTPDKRFFNSDAVHMPDPEIAALRRQFRLGVPNSWLRDRIGD